MLVSATSKVNTTPTNFLERRLLSTWSLMSGNSRKISSSPKNKATSGCPLLYVLQALKGSALYLRGDLSLLVLKTTKLQRKPVYPDQIYGKPTKVILKKIIYSDGSFKDF